MEEMKEEENGFKGSEKAWYISLPTAVAKYLAKAMEEQKGFFWFTE